MAEGGIKGKIGPIIVCVALVGVGVWAIVQPDLIQDADTSGRRAWLKTLIAWAWGRTGGVIAIILGGLGLAGSFLSDKDDDAGADPEADAESSSAASPTDVQ